MNKKDVRFIETVCAYYKEHGRHTLPWRKTRDPYRILVSEIMLQQTQVDRVVPKYEAFLNRFPTVNALASSSLGDVLRMWQGLGYNRRAKMLHACAQEVVEVYGGIFPKTHPELVSLPGIGPYTASAVMAFAFGTATPLIETNVRSVYLHHYHTDDYEVSDSELMQHIERTMPQEDIDQWYWALMDYGSYIKRTYRNPNTRSKHHTVQSTFKGSDRQIRGAIIRLLADKARTRAFLHTHLPDFDILRVDAQIEHLIQEGMIQKEGRRYRLP